MQKVAIILLFCYWLIPGKTVGQDIFKGYESLFSQPLSYTIHYTGDSITIDGRADEKAWQRAGWTENFTDIEGNRKPAPPLRTRVKMLWGENNLYIFAEMEDPHVWATLTQHDAIIFRDNDFEVFIDPDGDTHNYFEIEVNALNTIFDLFLSKPYRNQGTILTSWNAENLRSAVHVNGTLNQPGDTDKSWTVEMAIPFAALRTGGPFIKPVANTFWRLNFLRVQWDIEASEGKYKKKTDASGKALPEHNWAWSPQGIINMHYPERWGYVRFAGEDETGINNTTLIPAGEEIKKYLWLVYYKQKDHLQKNRGYAKDLAALDMPGTITLHNGSAYTLILEATPLQFTATILRNGREEWQIDQNGKITKATQQQP